MNCCAGNICRGSDLDAAVAKFGFDELHHLDRVGFWLEEQQRVVVGPTVTEVGQIGRTHEKGGTEPPKTKPKTEPKRRFKS